MPAELIDGVSYVRGHAPRMIRPGDWRCKCGLPLSGGPLGNGQRGAKDVMRFHQLDLRMARESGLHALLLASLSPAPSGCLLWTGRLDKDGYGRIRTGGRDRLVHRLVYELIEGPVPHGMELDHVVDRGCRNRHCANVAHLELVTHSVNVLRGDSPSAVNARKTNCRLGHPFDDSNTHVRPGGGRMCRACRRQDGDTSD